MNKDTETNANRQSHNVTAGTIQVSNRIVYNNIIIKIIIITIAAIII
jgi:hypothetical protein